MPLLKNILLIDDNQFNNYVNRNTILNANLASEIHIVHGGLEALHRLQQFRNENKMPDLILLDFGMGKLNGIEFLQLFEKMSFNKRPKIVVLATEENKTELEKASTYNVIGTLFKPLTVEKLKAVIESNFSQRQAS